MIKIKRLTDALEVIGEEFDDVELSIHDSPTKGTVAVVYFYEDKVEEII